MNRPLCAVFFAIFLSIANAEVTLPKLFSSHMILQRDMPVHVWGSADPGERVEIELHGEHASAVADSVGRWSIYLAPQPAGGPYTLTVRATNTLTFDDVLLGDLWVASGQSNMEMPLNGFPNSAVVNDAEKEIAAANYPQIRLMRVHPDASDYPLEDFKSVDGWSVCTPETARSFSAVGYFFARDLQQKEHVAIGVIDSTWGGTPAESWTSLDALASDAALMPVFASRAAMMDNQATAVRLEAIDKQLKAEGKPGIHVWHPNLVSWQPGGLFNAMIAPMTPMPIRGVIWYQGETNSSKDKVELYSRFFPAMIEDWRRRWAQGDFPFLYAQISSFDSPPEQWGLLRDAQRRTLKLANTGMAVTIDAGMEHNVHPSNKQVVGERLSLLARNLVFGEKITASGPLFRLAYPEGNTLRVWFDSAEGLRASPGANASSLAGFEIAGADGVFVPATVKIDGQAVVVSAPSIAEPRYVRYAWKNFTPSTIENGAGLPASTFTSYPVP